MKNKYPIYLPTYGRENNCKTAYALDDLGLDYTLVIEPEQYDDYAQFFDEDKLMIVPDEYHENYETFDDLGREKSQGPGVARNVAWDDAIEKGYDWHWVMDDNIRAFYRNHKNQQIYFGDGSGFRMIEDFCNRYENLLMAGPNYESFCARKQDKPPITFNTRIYSCNLIKNEAKDILENQWQGRYNEDTLLSLRMLKKGYCTALFNIVLADKNATQRDQGGNTTTIYKEGTYPKSAMLKERHPSVTNLVWKWNRWHHEVDYKPFKKNKLIERDPEDIPEAHKNNDYNLNLKNTRK